MSTVQADVVLVGGGHANIQVIKLLKQDEALNCFLLSDSGYAYYSGMIPAHVAGVYCEDACRVDLKALCCQQGWTFILGRANFIDPSKRIIQYVGENDEQYQLCYRVASIDVGSRTRWPFGDDTNSVSPCIISTRPINILSKKIADAVGLLQAKSVIQPFVCVVGAGAAGVELTFALYSKLQVAFTQPPMIILVSSSSTILPTYSRSTRQKAATALQNIGVEIRTNERIVKFDEDKSLVINDLGHSLKAHIVVLACCAHSPAFFIGVTNIQSGPAAHEWLESSQVPLDTRGFIRIENTLQLVGFSDTYAVGDCASLDDYHGTFPPKAGVYAVMEGPILARNIKITLAQHGRLKQYYPQREFLSLIITGRDCAIGTKWGFTMQGRCD
eukprot:gene2652-5553_t